MTPDLTLVDMVSPSPNFGDRRGRAVDAIILHYTGMSTCRAARARLLDPASQVSCHYLVWEDGRIEQMVAEKDRAWHAGRSYWAGETDMNSVSIGIEIVNAGHDGGCPPYPEPQIEAVVALTQDICRRHAIPAHRVLAHSDISPDRKIDPGEWFPWARLAESGVGLWVDRAIATIDAGRPDDRENVDMKNLQERLATFGYDCPISAAFDTAMTAAVMAFQRHYRPDRVDGVADVETLMLLDRLLAIRP